MIRASIIILIIISWMLVSSCVAQDISVSASVNSNTASVGGGIMLSIHIEGAQNVPAPRLPRMSGLSGQYIGPNTQMSIVNGQTSLSVEHRYNIRAIQAGQHTIPAITINYGGKKYKTDPIKIQVNSSRGSAQKRDITQEDLKQYVRLEIIVNKKTAYVNEKIPLILRMYVRSGVQIQELSRRPELPSAGFSVLPMANPTQRRTTIDGVRHVVVDFATTAYPVRSGELVLGPAEVECIAIVRSDQFRRAVRTELTVKSEPYKITVKPLPAENQPENFSGVVGQYDLNVAARPTNLKVGEPITLTMRVRGIGNIDAVNLPVITDLTQFKVYDPQVNVSKQGNIGMKTFEQVLIPMSDEIKAIPEIQFCYFDTETGEYKTKSQGPISIEVAPSDDAPLEILEMSKGKAVKREVLGRDIVYIKDEIGNSASGEGRLYKNKGFILLQLVPLFGFAGMLFYQKRRDRFATDRTYARQYHAPRKAKKGLAQAQELIAANQPQEFCSTIFKTMQEYLGDRFNLPSAGITIEIVGSLRSQNFAEEILEKMTGFFQKCDRMRFAQSEIGESDMKETLNLAEEIIGLFENKKAIAV